MPKLRLAVLLTGSGTTLENIFEKCADGKLNAEVAVVVSSRADAYGVERARRRNVPTQVVERKRYISTEAFSHAIFEALEPGKPDMIVLAGFMSLLCIPPQYTNRVINVHPSLLPSFGGKGYYGHKVHEAVLKHGCKMTGCTVHFVDNVYDQGPIIAQKAVPVLPGDTVDSLAARVQEAEREIYPEVLQCFAESRVSIKDRVVTILPKS